MKTRRGFTLIEMLVVMAIVAVLAAVIIPNLAGILAGSKDKANKAELSIVQTALDTYMADQTISTVPSQLSEDDFATTAPVLYPAYLRLQVAHCSYSWDESGLVSQTPESCP